MQDLLGASVISLIVGIGLWSAFIFGIHKSNFTVEGQRKFPARGGTAAIRSSEIEYHNKAIYGDFELFIKVTLAILGGTAFVLTSKDLRSAEAAVQLTSAGAFLQFIVGLLFAVFVALHEKSKIERWEKSFKWHDMLSWQETWMALTMFVISCVYSFAFAPQLIATL